MIRVRKVLFWIGIAMVVEDGIGHLSALSFSAQERYRAAIDTGIFFIYPHFQSWDLYNVYWALWHFAAAAFVIIGRRA